MHWLEKWMRDECAVSGEKNPCENCREICVPCMILSQETGAYVSTIKKLALEPGFLTCATLANRIAQKTGATAAQRDMLVAPIHHGKWKPDRRFKTLKIEKALPQTPAAEPEPQPLARAVVMIDRRGADQMRFNDAVEAAIFNRRQAASIVRRCERDLQQITDEFAPSGVSFRWADEWDAMTDVEKRQDVSSQTITRRIQNGRKRYEWQGKSHTIAEWARIVNLPEAALRKRIRSGWSFEEAVKTPVKER